MSTPLAIDSRGTGGLPILFAHSFAGDSSHWTPTLEHLQSRCRVIAFDFHGHGKSPPAHGRYSYEELAKDISAVADAEQLDRFVLVGHSMGAAIAAEYAARHASRVKALVLVDAPPAPGAVPPGQIRQIHDALEKDPYAVVEQFWSQQMFIDARPEVRQRLLSALRRLPRNATIELTREAFAVDSSLALRRYPGPKFAIVTPRNDAPLSLHNAVPDVTHAIVSGTGHWIHLDDPAAFNRALDEFLKRISHTP
ncbi:MAG TPA: alpha/beta hydrolase [Steroidobacteraceae bacterium]|nr:alpha/beta hydrolase [Steroidobacteraceae bacterium]